MGLEVRDGIVQLMAVNQDVTLVEDIIMLDF